MPQMAPINWTITLMYFIMIFMMFNIINYYSFFYILKSYNFMKMNLKFNWKW